MLDLKFVPSANWASLPFQGPQIVVIDEQNRQGFWGGSGYALPGSSDVPAGYTLIAAANYTFGTDPVSGLPTANYPKKLYCTNAGGCAIAIPDGLASGVGGQAMQGTGGGPVSVTGSALQPSGTLATSYVGQIIGWERTVSTQANECVVAGYTPDGPRYIGKWATFDLMWAAVSAAISSLNHGDFMICEEYGGVRWVPNLAKTRLRPDSGLLILPGGQGTVAAPLGAPLTGAGSTNNTQWGITEPEVPANMLGAGDEVYPFMLLDKTGANATSEAKIYFGPTNDLAGQNVINIASGAPANDGWYEPMMRIVGPTSAICTRSLDENSPGTGNPATLTINTAVRNYIAFSSQLYNTSDSVALLAFGAEIKFAP